MPVTIDNQLDNLLDNLPAIIEDLAYCESSNNPEAYVENDGGSPSIGLLQFKEDTWKWANKRYGVNLSIDNPEHQKFIAWYMLKEGRFSHWRVCLQEYLLIKVYE